MYRSTAERMRSPRPTENADTLERLADYLERGAPGSKADLVLIRDAEDDSREYGIVHNSTTILEKLAQQFLPTGHGAQPPDDPPHEAFER